MSRTFFRDQNPPLPPPPPSRDARNKGKVPTKKPLVHQPESSEHFNIAADQELAMWTTVAVKAALLRRARVQVIISPRDNL
tara:strand:+ start:257 stop:499 length:243 start_codon:yes stop_codon:yes gene_type:complete